MNPTPDANVNAVIESHALRAAHGFKKYGVTTERKDLTMTQWLQHLQDEVMDAAVYAERLKSLAAVVDRLPRTKDGVYVVPFVDRVYWRSTTLADGDVRSFTVGGFYHGQWETTGGMFISQCYSTPELAQAAS